MENKEDILRDIDLQKLKDLAFDEAEWLGTWNGDTTEKYQIRQAWRVAANRRCCL